MGASSVQGTGPGSAEGKTTQNLSTRPMLIATGIAETVDVPVSPTTAMATVTFPEPLIGGPDNYVIMLTGLSVGDTYVASTTTSGGNFTSFTIASGDEGSVYYMVTTKGFRTPV